MIRSTFLCLTMLMSGCAMGIPQNKQASALDIEFISALPSIVKETSGLALKGGYFWTMNDSGGKAAVYAIDPKNYEIHKRVDLKKAKNIDWESLAQDEKYLYVADCGNNRAKRKKLQIYKSKWKSLLSAEHKEDIKATKIQISYADQKDKESRWSHNFDCEGVTSVGDQLWLFTKNRGDSKTRLYTIDKEKKKQVLSPVLEMDVQGLITAADYHQPSNQLALLGYQKASAFGASFLWVMSVKDGLPDWENAKYHQLKPYGQWEAVSWESNSTLLLTSETSPIGKRKLGRVDLNPLLVTHEN